MSDCATKRFGEKEKLQVLSSQSDLRKSYYRKQSLWMPHWTRASSSAEPQRSKSYSPFEEIGVVGYSKDCATLPFKIIKTRMSERLMLGVSNGGASAGNTNQSSSKMCDIKHNVCQGVECNNVDQVGRSCESSMAQKNLNLYAAETVVSERFSLHKISDISLNSRKVLSSDNLNLEWNHFPMFEINQKIDSILNPRRSADASPEKCFVPQKDLKVNNMSTSNAMAFSSKEYQFHSHQRADENMTRCRSAGDILSHQDKHIDLHSDHAGRKLKGHLSIEESCSCRKNETKSSCSMTDKLCASNLIVSSKESPCCSNENKFMFTERRKENENVDGALQEKKLGALGGCTKEQDFERVAHNGPVLGTECEVQPVNASASSKGNDVETSGRGMVFANLLQSEQKNLHTHTVNSATKVTEPLEVPGKVENMLPTKSKVERFALGKPPKDILTDSKRKVPCLFEMLTLPSKSQATSFNDPISLGRSCGNLASCSLGAQKRFTTKTDPLYSGTHHASGFTSTSTQKPTIVPKDPDSPNMAKFEQIATSSIERVSRCSGGNEITQASTGNQNSNPKEFKETRTNKQEWSMSKTSSLNLDLVLFQISRMRNPISSALIESPVCSEPSHRWLKRLQHDISDPNFPCSKRPKLGDGPPPGQTCTVFGQKLNFDMGEGDMINYVEDQLRHGRLMNQQNEEGSPFSAKSLNHWIGRWCQGGVPIFHVASNVEKQTPKCKPLDDPEGQFPSIAAMAMMGRVMNKLRLCELEKRGPSVVWKTQGL